MTSLPTQPTTAHRPQWVRAARVHLRIYLIMWVWCWTLCLLGVTVAIVVANQLGGVTMSFAQFVRNGPLVWFLFSISIAVVASYITPHVANGMTRRSFARAALAAGAVSGVAHGATSAVFVLLEGVVYEQAGWPHLATEGKPGLWSSGAGPLLLDHTLASVAGTVSGLLVAVAYYRLGGWKGTAFLPLALLPILGLMFMTSWSWDASQWRVGQPVGTVLAALLILGGGAAFAQLVRNVPISRTES